MLITTWNVNSLKMRLEHTILYLKENQPDFLLLQEIKGLDEEIFREFVTLGYKSYCNLQKTYNGVVILSKHDCNLVTNNLSNLDDNQARLIEVQYDNFSVINVYVPNGNPLDTDKYTYKINWLNAFYDYIKMSLEQEKNFIIGGDFNIAPQDIDVYSPEAFKNDALTSIAVRDVFFKLINLGLTDALRYAYPYQEKLFTWWDYRNTAFARNNGVRIDHILLSPFMANKYKNSFVDKSPRIKDKPSDHTPVVCELF